MDRERIGAGIPLPEVEIGEDLPDFLDAHRYYTETKAEFFTACEAYVNNEKRSVELLVKQCNDYASSFIFYVKAMFEEFDDDRVSISRLAIEMFHEDDERIAKFKSLCPANLTLAKLSDKKDMQKGGLLKQLERARDDAPDRERFIDSWQDDYTDLVQRSFSSFINTPELYEPLSKQDEAESDQATTETQVITSPPKPSLKNEIGRHVLDVAKLVGGVAGGIILARLAQRKT